MSLKDLVRAEAYLVEVRTWVPDPENFHPATEGTSRDTAYLTRRRFFTKGHALAYARKKAFPSSWQHLVSEVTVIPLQTWQSGPTFQVTKDGEHIERADLDPI